MDRKRFGAGVCGYCIALSVGVAGAAEPGRHEFAARHMGAPWRIVTHAADEPTARRAAEAAFRRVAELEKVMSDYDQQSELSKLCRANDAAPGRPIPIGDDLFDVLSRAKEVAVLSDGAFDPTVGPLVRLWRIARRTQQLPNAAELRDALARSGHEKLALDAKDRTATLAVAGMRLDLGGIGKGYAADAALEVLKRHGCPRSLVAASGDVRVGDPPPGEATWTVAIAPLAADRPARKLMLANRAISTSGDLFQFVEIGGVRYSHVLDPKSGVGLTGRRSVTVVAPTGTQADALSKVASVLPPERALPLLEAMPGVAAYLVTRADDAAPEVVRQTAGFAGLAKP